MSDTRSLLQARPSELEMLIREQAKDAATDRCWSISLDQMGDGIYVRPRGRVTDPRHGTEGLYQHGPCRCAKCRSAHATYRQSRRMVGKEAWK